MRRLPIIALGTAMAFASAGSQAAGEWAWFAGWKDGYTTEPAASIFVGSLDPDIKGADSDTVTGIELSLNCPLLQPPTDRIRQQVSYVRYDNKGLEITSIELNPHYVIETSPGLEVGFGPGLGYVMVKAGALDDSVLALQLGVSAHYTVSDPLFLGAEARYQMTDDLNNNQDVDNVRIGVKVGVSF